MENFLKKFRVHEKLEAKSAAKRAEIRTGEKIFCNELMRIEAYLRRLEEIFLSRDPKRGENIKEIFLEKYLYPEVIINKENFPESYFEDRVITMKNSGVRNVEFTQEDKDKEILKIQEAQKRSLNLWIDYLTRGSTDGFKCPTYIKYFVIQGILKLGDFEDNGDKYYFRKRNHATTQPFAEMDTEALSLVLGAIQAVHRKEEDKLSQYSPILLTMIKNNTDFGALYAQAMFEEDAKAGKKELLPTTEGEWKIFKKGSSAFLLSKALVGKRSNLCLSDVSSAEEYLEKGDIELYFSKDKDGNNTLPRIVIVSNENIVSEVRGTYNKNEEMDPYIEQTTILQDKLANTENGESFIKKDFDMKKLTSIYQKIFKEDKKTNEKTFINESLDKDELKFLYQMDSRIDSHGLDTEDDPRILEILSTRDIKEDIRIIFENKLAFSLDEIKEDTIAYIGEFEINKENINKFKKLEYVYKEFPNNKLDIFKFNHMEYPKTKEEWVKFLKVKNISMSDNEDFEIGLNMEGDVNKMLEKMKNSELSPDQKFIGLKVLDLFGDTEDHKYEDIYKKVKELGLDLCEQDDGPKIILSTKLKIEDWYITVMEPILVKDNQLRVWDLFYPDNGQKNICGIPTNIDLEYDNFKSSRYLICRIGK